MLQRGCLHLALTCVSGDLFTSGALSVGVNAFRMRWDLTAATIFSVLGLIVGPPTQMMSSEKQADGGKTESSFSDTQTALSGFRVGRGHGKLCLGSLPRDAQLGIPIFPDSLPLVHLTDCMVDC